MGEVIVAKPLSSHLSPDLTTRTSPEIKGVKGGDVKSGDTCEESGFATITSPTLCGLVYDMAIKDKLFLEGLDERHLDGKFELPDKNFQGCNRITHRTFIWWRYFR